MPKLEGVPFVRSRVQKFPAWHTKAAPNGKCCEGFFEGHRVTSSQMWKVCWNKGRLCWKITKLFYFCHLKKLVRPETFGPYYVCESRSYVVRHKTICFFKRYILFHPFWAFLICAHKKYSALWYPSWGVSVVLMFKIDYLASSYYSFASFCHILLWECICNLCLIFLHFFFSSVNT